VKASTTPRRASSGLWPAAPGAGTRMDQRNPLQHANAMPGGSAPRLEAEGRAAAIFFENPSAADRNHQAAGGTDEAHATNQARFDHEGKCRGPSAPVPKGRGRRCTR